MFCNALLDYGIHGQPFQAKIYESRVSSYPGAVARNVLGDDGKTKAGQESNQAAAIETGRLKEVLIKPPRVRLDNATGASEATAQVHSPESSVPKANADCQENRTRFRSSIELPMRITVCDRWRVRMFVKATCTDFTEDGVAFETDADLTVGEVVLLEFLVAGERRPNDQSLARVVHREGTSYGASFLV